MNYSLSKQTVYAKTRAASFFFLANVIKKKKERDKK